MKEDQMNLNFDNLFSLRYYKSIAMETIWILYTTPFTLTQVTKTY